MEFTAETLIKNWEDFQSIIKKSIPSRADELIKMYDKFEDRVMYAPASGMEHYHNAFPGGYVDHVIRVFKCAHKVYESWSDMGADMSGYTLEELSFAAINHDLGKIGDMDNPYYEPNQSEWHRKNQGKIYDYNANIVNMEVPHRGLWMLQNHGIHVSQNEYIAIMIHDGMYVEGNWFYYKNKTKPLHTNMALILHQADLMASRIEYERWKNNSSSNPTQTSPIKTKKVLSDSTSRQVDVFKDLFG